MSSASSCTRSLLLVPSPPQQHSDQEKSLAQLGTTPAEHQALKPIDASTLERLSHEQLIDLLWDGLGGLFTTTAEPPALALARGLVQQANDAAGHAWGLEPLDPDQLLTPEQEADLSGSWAQADQAKALAIHAIEQLLPPDCAPQ
jgi:hypothetical protein